MDFLTAKSLKAGDIVVDNANQTNERIGEILAVNRDLCLIQWDNGENIWRHRLDLEEIEFLGVV